MRKRRVFVCTGKHCRKAAAGVGGFDEALASLPGRLTPVGCQKVCKGPVVGVSPADGGVEWFRKVDSPKAWRGLARLLEEGHLSGALRKRRQKSRAGRVRK